MFEATTQLQGDTNYKWLTEGEDLIVAMQLILLVDFKG